MRKQIEIKSPVRAKDLEGKFHVLFKALVGADGSRKELFDTDKMVTLIRSNLVLSHESVLLSS